MKKLFVIFLTCVTVLYSFTGVFALEQGAPGDLFSDLTLIAKYEGPSELKVLQKYSEEVQQIILDRKLNSQMLYSIIYSGSYIGIFDAASLNKSINHRKDLQMDAPLFRSELYNKYYKARTEKLLKTYRASGILDYGAFYKAGRAEFDGFMKTAFKNSQEKDKLFVLLQEKLTDKLIETELTKKKALGEELISLRLPANNKKCLDLLYQFFESRTRLELLREVAEIDRQELIKLTEGVSIVVKGSINGSVGIYSKTPEGKLEVHKLLSEANEQEGYRSTTYMKVFADDTFTLGFAQDGKPEVIVNADTVLKAIQTDQNGYLVLDIDNLLSMPQPKAPDKPVSVPPNPSQAAELKSLEAAYKAKSKAASTIVKELNRYSMYLELKDQKISNYYTRSFENNQKLWKKDLEAKLDGFGKDGTADFWIYIKRFAVLDKAESKSDSTRQLIAKYRNSDIQFKSPQSGMLWITDMLYELRTAK